MNRGAGEAHARIDHPRMGVQAAKGGQQRGVNDDQPVAPLAGKAFGQQPHESGETYQLGAGGADRFAERGLELGSRRKGAMVHDCGRNPGCARAFQAVGVGLVRDHGDDLGREVGRGAGFDHGRKVAARP